MRIRWTPAAAADLQQISDYLREHHPHYRQATLRKLYDTIHKLREAPHPGKPGRVEGTRDSRDQVSELIANDFLEFGQSGGTFNKRDTLDSLDGEAVDLQVEVSDFAARELSQEVVLVTYTAVMLDSDQTTKVATNRTSVWVLRDGRWQMTFHQGTRKSVGRD